MNFGLILKDYRRHDVKLNQYPFFFFSFLFWGAGWVGKLHVHLNTVSQLYNNKSPFLILRRKEGELSAFIELSGLAWP